MLGNDQRKTLRNTGRRISNLIDQLFIDKKIPQHGWSEPRLTALLATLAEAESNNNENFVGAGEREGRVACPLVNRLHGSLTHGIGRSGNIVEAQPKAIGSSMINDLANSFALQALHVFGLKSTSGALALPVCTGMALTLSLLCLRQKRPDAKFVLWSRIDQKSCLKCIYAAGLEPIVIHQRCLPCGSTSSLSFSQVGITAEDLESSMIGIDAKDVLCLLSTTSCFAPRRPDNVVQNGEFARKYGFFHVVNNAYGLQSSEIVTNLEAGLKANFVDFYVQSMDKNFLVPVGGSIVASRDRQMVAMLGKMYPGRASAVPSRDLVLTLLHFGIDGLTDLHAERVRVYDELRSQLYDLADEIGEVVVEPSGNGISFAMTLTSLPLPSVKLFGGILFQRYKITGARVVVPSLTPAKIETCQLTNFGSHCPTPAPAYITVAAAVGMRQDEAGDLVSRLRLAVREAQGGL